MSQMRSRLIESFGDPEYRHNYTESFYDTLVAAQLRALRTERGWKQAELGEKTGTSQSGISAFESSDYSKWNIQTLRKFARVFDVAVAVKFIRFGEMLDEIGRFSRAAVFVPSYDEDWLRPVPDVSADSLAP